MWRFSRSTHTYQIRASLTSSDSLGRVAPSDDKLCSTAARKVSSGPAPRVAVRVQAFIIFSRAIALVARSISGVHFCPLASLCWSSCEPQSTSPARGLAKGRPQILHSQRKVVILVFFVRLDISLELSASSHADTQRATLQRGETAIASSQIVAAELNRDTRAMSGVERQSRLSATSALARDDTKHTRAVAAGYDFPSDARLRDRRVASRYCSCALASCSATYGKWGTRMQPRHSSCRFAPSNDTGVIRQFAIRSVWNNWRRRISLKYSG